MKTAMADAFARAGWGSGKLMREVAEELLRKHKTVDAARGHFHLRVTRARDWMRDLEIFYLTMVQAELQNGGSKVATLARNAPPANPRAPQHLATITPKRRRANPPRVKPGTIIATDKRTAEIYEALQVADLGNRSDSRWLGNVRLSEAGGLADRSDHHAAFWRKIENFAKNHANPEEFIRRAISEDMIRAFLMESRVLSKSDIERAIARRRNGSAPVL